MGHSPGRRAGCWSGGAWSIAETVTDAENLYKALKAKGWKDADLKYTVVPGGRHNEKAWSERFGDILRFLFPPTP